MSSLKPMTLYGHDSGPNAWRVAIILEELSIPYTHKFIDFADMKKDPYESINPNGRVPAIEDPNTNTTLWESGAILEYLVSTYDKKNTISFTPGSPEIFQTTQWLFYQASGQGPYFGQAVWFTVYHPEKIPAIIERYVKEINRVSTVLNKFLMNKEYLVGNKYTYADAAFVTWFIIVGLFGEQVKLEADHPHLNAWLERMKARPAIAKILKDREDAMVAAKGK